MANYVNNTTTADDRIELITIPHDHEEAVDQRYERNTPIEINNDSMYTLDRIHSNLNKRETIERTPVTLAVNDLDKIQNNSMTQNPRIVEETTKVDHLIATNILNDIQANLRPIVEYAKEPLLPLSKACTPLENILHDLSVYVKMAIDETSEQPPDGLTVDESAAIRLYTIEWDKPYTSLYSMLNYTLKNESRENLKPYFKYLKLFITALAKLPCIPQLTVWRGVPKNLSMDFPSGTKVTWWSFSSCTTEMTVLQNNMYLGFNGNRTLFSVEAINGRSIRAHSHFNTENEVLLLPGTHMVVQSQLNPAPELYIIHLKQIEPPQVLLAPPFEGILNIFSKLFLNNIISTFRCTSLSDSTVSLA
ncbi:unnamed protein product [Adineta steineri]|uniref:NAD(P)(+)--arginine ADP-ribosyltransferase n=1 Tax=Adineta steineri TaxID=433720 RepID=A0A814IF53_9BILA|nr:unnamed protein product [Adineta steineri]CAF1024930.1 unnamed protein product [Adineta steineri]